jgi:peroxiredoxin
MAPLKAGDDAPDFSVSAVVGNEKMTVKLADYLGKKNVVIAFYPLNWTPV